MAATTSEIFQAIAEGDLDRVRKLVAEDPTIAGARDAQGLSAVTQARYHGHDDIVEAFGHPNIARLLARQPRTGTSN